MKVFKGTMSFFLLLLCLLAVAVSVSVSVPVPVVAEAEAEAEPGSVQVQELPDSVVVTVDHSGDPLPSNTSTCVTAPGTGTNTGTGGGSGQCSLRAALLVCVDHLVSSVRTCTVQLPTAMHVMFNTTEGQVSFNSFNTAGSLIIRGEGSIVAPMVTGELGLGVSESRLLEVDATVGRTLSFHMSNITISSFGSDTIEGGAVRLVDLAAGSMSNVVFRNNSGSSGGAVFMDDSPGFRFVDCVFDSNSALNDGGGLLISTASSGVQVEACVFTGNRVRDGMGGGIYILNNNNDIFIDRCNFTQNFAVRGAGLNVNNYNYRMNISSTVFLNNTATDRGGGLSISSFNYYFLMDKCLLQGNTAVYKYGGAFYIYADNWYITVQYSNFIENVAELYGGAVDLYSNNDFVMFIHSNFLRNTGRHGGAGVDSYTDNDDMSFYNCEFGNNIAYIEGGGLFIGTSNDRYILQNCNFWHNWAGSYGGAILLIRENYQLHLTNCTFTDSVSGSAGGALHSALLNSRMIFKNCAFFRSMTRSYGGALYFGEDHSEITFLNVNFTSNTADTGGALYLSKFNTEIVLEKSLFIKNIAVYTGGAVVSLASEMFIRNCIFEHNAAKSTGALHSISGTFGTLGHLSVLDTIFNANEATGSFGAMYLEFCENCIVNDVKFTANTARDQGGALALLNSVNTRVDRGVFEYNTVDLTAGAFYLHGVEDTSVKDCSFLHNFADMGGALYVDESMNASLSNVRVWNNSAVRNAAGMGIYDSMVILTGSSFLSNNATTGSGSALHIMASDVVMLSNNFEYNWCGQAGTVFWDYASGMSEPRGLNTSENTFSDTNSAKYGPYYATQGVRMKLENATYTVEDYTVPAPPVIMTLTDYYDQTVLTESSAIVQVNEFPSYCHGMDPYITGGITERFNDGVATFANMAAYCAAGYNMTIGFTTSVVTQSVTAILSFRECKRGEYFSDRVCTSCPVGSYSLVEPNTKQLSDLTHSVCEQCPNSDIAKYCAGDSIFLQEGQWRISTSTDFILSCPKDAPSCQGGLEAADDSCGEGYHGPLCAICDNDYFYSSASNTCEMCSNESAFSDPLVLTIIILGFLASGVFIVMSMKKIKQANVQTMDDLVILIFFNGRFNSSSDPVADKKRALAQSRSLRGHLKVYVTYFQILATLPHILDIGFPQVFTKAMSSISFLNLEIVQSSLVSCSSASVPDHVDILYAETIYPFILAIFVFALHKVHVIMASRHGSLDIKQLMKIRSLYVSLLLTFSYLILPHITAHVLSTFNCIDVDEDDAVDGKDIYLASDLSISCTSDRYRFALVWAIISIFLYPIGMPALYYYILYSHKEDIINRETPLLTDEEEEQRVMRIRPLRLLYDFYHPKFWYWEVIETLLRLSVTGFLVLFGVGSSLQVTAGLLIALVYVNLYLEFKPLFSEKLHQTKIATLWQLYFIFFCAFIIKANFVDSENTYLVVGLMIMIFASCVKNLFDLTVQQTQTVNNFRQNLGNKVRQLSRGGINLEMDKLFRDKNCDSLTSQEL